MSFIAVPKGRKLARYVALALVVLVVGGGCGARQGDADLEDDVAAGVISDRRIPGEGAAGSSLEQFETSGVVAAGGLFEDVRFGYDSSELDPAGLETVRRNAEVWRQQPELRVEIEGHCDERGTSEYNLALGARRGRAVRDALLGLGVGADKLSTVSYGEELPLCKEATDQCRQRNRRARLVDLGRP